MTEISISHKKEECFVIAHILLKAVGKMHNQEKHIFLLVILFIYGSYCVYRYWIICFITSLYFPIRKILIYREVPILFKFFLKRLVTYWLFFHLLDNRCHWWHLS